ncbi:MAG: O-methyltransferase, partial [Flavobacteriales bacterium]
MRPWSDRWFEMSAYFRHLLNAVGPHGVHSPFVFDLLTFCSKSPIDISALQQLKQLRAAMRRDSRRLQKTDWGTGKSGEVKVSSMAVRSAQPLHHAIYIARLAQQLRCKTIVELGTSLGFTTAALGLLNKEARVFSIEGCMNTAQIAKENMARLNVSNVSILSGEAMNVMLEWKTEILSADFIFIDCNHTYLATENFISFFEASEKENLTIVLDDI